MNKDDSGKFISAQGASPRVAGLCGELQEERVLFDLADPVVLDTLRADAMRMAASMDDPAEEPPMLWSGVPWPRGEAPLRSDYCLSISVGGSKMVALLLRVEGGEFDSWGTPDPGDDHVIVEVDSARIGWTDEVPLQAGFREDQ